MRYRGYFSLIHGKELGPQATSKDYAMEFNVGEFENPKQVFKCYTGMFVDRFDVEGLSLGDLDEIGADDKACPLTVVDLSEDPHHTESLSNAEKDLTVRC